MSDRRNWSFFRMPLYQRLVLAMLPAFPVLAIFLEDSPRIHDFLDRLYLLHSALFGILILAPFISTSVRRVLRIVTLMLIPVLVLALLNVLLKSGFGLVDYIYPNFIAYFVVFAVLLALAVKFVAPLAVGFRYWSLVIICGSITGLGFGIWLDLEFSCLFRSCPVWYDWIFVVALAFWHLSFCMAVYFGRASCR